MITMYEWSPIPSGPSRPSGVSDSRERAEDAAASALAADPGLMAVVIAEVEAASFLAPYRPTGRTWTWRRTGAGIEITEARAEITQAA